MLLLLFPVCPVLLYYETMSKYIPDISTRRWVIISQNRLLRPNESNKKTGAPADPFAPGAEKESEEVMRLGRGEKNKPGWDVRVVKNKFPITDYHEVIIHSPDPKKDIEDLPEKQIELILHAYRERYNFYKKKGQVLIFCNHGEHAGSSLSHPHSQLVVIPSQINIDVLPREAEDNIIEQNKYFTLYCPDFSQWPYEVWIAPKKTDSTFGDIDDEAISHLAKHLKLTLNKLRDIYAKNQFVSLPFGYNFYIYPDENWYVRIIPRFIHRAGFELGTGLSVNIIDPTDAAAELRGEDKNMIDMLSKLKEKSTIKVEKKK